MQIVLLQYDLNFQSLHQFLELVDTIAEWATSLSSFEGILSVQQCSFPLLCPLSRSSTFTLICDEQSNDTTFEFTGEEPPLHYVRGCMCICFLLPVPRTLFQNYVQSFECIISFYLAVQRFGGNVQSKFPSSLLGPRSLLKSKKRRVNLLLKNDARVSDSYHNLGSYSNTLSMFFRMNTSEHSCGQHWSADKYHDHSLPGFHPFSSEGIQGNGET